MKLNNFLFIKLHYFMHNLLKYKNLNQMLQVLIIIKFYYMGKIHYLM